MTDPEIRRLFEVAQDALKKEAITRERLFSQAGGKYKFSMDEEREIGTAAMLACHLREAGFFARLDWYFSESIPARRPDLAVWLPSSNRLLYLELKRVGQGWSYKGLQDDLKKLEKVSGTTGDTLNGLLVVGFAKRRGLEPTLRVKLSKLLKTYPNYYLMDQPHEFPAKMDNQLVYMAIALLLRKAA